MSTSRPTSHEGPGGHPLFLLFILIIAGLAGNAVEFSILNAHFIFGSIFSMLALQFFGPGRGILSAIIISSYTYLKWNHPYAIITMAAELAVVGWLFTRHRVNLLTADTLYWIVIGMPLGFFCFHLIADFPVGNAIFVMMKQAVNGMANALVARLIFTGYALRSNSTPISFREIVANLFAFFVLLSTLIMLTVSSKTEFAETDRRIRTSLLDHRQHAVDCYKDWSEDISRPVSHLASLAKKLSLTEMQTYMEHTRKSNNDFLRIVLLDGDSTVIACAPTVDEQGRDVTGESFADRSHISVLKQTLKPVLSEVLTTRFKPPVPVVVLLVPIVSRGVYDGAVGGIINFDRMQEFLHISSPPETGMMYALLDKDSKVIWTDKKNHKMATLFSRGEGNLRLREEGIAQWIPKLSPNASTLDLWGKSTYVAEINIDNPVAWKLVLEQPVAPFQQTLYERYAREFTLVFLILIGALVTADVVSRRLSKTNEQLCDLTIGLTGKLTSGVQIEWPESGIEDNKKLVTNIKEMANLLTTQLNDIRQMNESLEERIEERTHELQASEERFRRLAENAKDMIYRMSLPYGKYEYVSPASTEIFGYTPEEFFDAPKLIQEIIHPDFLEYFSEQWEKLLVGDMPPSYEYKIIHKSGKEKWLFQRNVLIHGERGAPAAIEGIVTDVTDRKVAEEALRTSEAQLSNAIEIAQLGYWGYDVPKDLFIFNDQFYALFRTTAEQTGGYMMSSARYAERFVHPEDMAVVGEEIRKAIETNDPNYRGHLEHRIVYADGETGFINVRFSIIKDEQGRTVKTFGANQDITARKKTEQEKRELEIQLRQAHKMEAIGTLAGGIAHDFNNILTPILIQTELAKMTIAGDHSVQSNLDEVMKAGHRAKDLVKQILAFSRQTDQQRVPMDLIPTVKESLNLLRSSLPKTIKIIPRLDVDPCMVFADPIQMQQIVMNLCTNACQAMEETGNVLEIALEHVALDEEAVKDYRGLDAGRYIMLKVSDTGRGIEVDVLDRVFDPFFTTKGPGEGTGMGLSVVHGIVQNHGGAIAVVSERGKGATFRVFLPEIEHEATEERITVTTLPTGNERILFVDDEESLVALGRKMLERLGYQVKTRTDSVEALVAFKEHPDQFDLVMTDMTMPNMTGERLAKELWRVRGDIPIILCSGFSQQMDEEKALGMGIQAFVMKPFIMKDVAETVRKVLDAEKKVK